MCGQLDGIKRWRCALWAVWCALRGSVVADFVRLSKTTYDVREDRKC